MYASEVAREIRDKRVYPWNEGLAIFSTALSTFLSFYLLFLPDQCGLCPPFFFFLEPSPHSGSYICIDELAPRYNRIKRSLTFKCLPPPWFVFHSQTMSISDVSWNCPYLSSHPESKLKWAMTFYEGIEKE